MKKPLITLALALVLTLGSIDFVFALPANAYAFGEGWACNLGFKASGSECNEMTSAEKQKQLELIATYSSARVYEVDCDGYGSETGTWVYGTCADGDFEGNDSDTGEYVYGSCEIGGSFDAFNSDTDEYVYGDCED
jgi:hypothetical protein